VDLVLGGRRADQEVPVRIRLGEVLPAVHAELLVDVAQVGLDRAAGDAQTRGDAVRTEPTDDE